MNESTTAFKNINLQYLDMMTEGDSDTRQTMLEMICEEVPAEMKKMVTAWKNGDVKTLKEVSHKMKSTLAFVGNDALTEANRGIEQVAMGYVEKTQLAGYFEVLENRLPEVLADLQAAAG